MYQHNGSLEVGSRRGLSWGTGGGTPWNSGHLSGIAIMIESITVPKP